MALALTHEGWYAIKQSNQNKLYFQPKPVTDKSLQQNNVKLSHLAGETKKALTISATSKSTWSLEIPKL